jgi:DMSO/TMAO reductase YedYZ molybdopterin-dependent catalytic subunit
MSAINERTAIMAASIGTALHPQTIMAVKFTDATLPAKYGYPFKLGSNWSSGS